MYSLRFQNIRTYFETVFVHGWVGVGHAQERVYRPAGEDSPIDGAGQLARFYAHRRSGHRYQAVILRQTSSAADGGQGANGDKPQRSHCQLPVRNIVILLFFSF